jgi:hypothetical protein
LKKATNKELRHWFRKFNKEYFETQLREPEMVAYVDLAKAKSDGMSGQLADGKYFIYIDKGLRHYPDLSLIVLLHEMAHTRFGKNIKPHGYQFQSEIVRLWNLGAYEDLL